MPQNPTPRLTRPLGAALLCSALALPALADDVTLTSSVRSATLFPYGAEIGRVAEFDLPAGTHRLILQDLPLSVPLDRLRLAADGLALGTVTTRSDATPPRADNDRPEIVAAKDRIESLEEGLRQLGDERESALIAARAAEHKLAALQDLAVAAAGAEPDRLAALLETVGAQSEAALRAAQQARITARQFEPREKALQEDLEKAHQALAALVEEPQQRAYLAVEVRADAPVSGGLTLTYLADEAGWQPAYDLHLDRTAGEVRVDRGAQVFQETGENWENVALTLSTQRPSEQGTPQELWPWLIEISDPETPVLRQKMSADMADEAAMAYAGATLAERAAPAMEVVEGIRVSYAPQAPVTLASGADRVRIPLGESRFEADIYALAVPQRDQTAFLMAGVKNSSDAVILPVPDAGYYLDGAYVGQRPLPLIAASDKAELSFGPIEGIQIEQIVKDRNEGDRGFVRRANERVEEQVLRLRNLTGRAWPLRMQALVPHSDQEDLVVNWQAEPMPQRENIDDKRGIHEWRFELAPNETREVPLTVTLRWPEGKVLN